MTLINQETLPPEDAHALYQTISHERLGTYVIHAGHDHQRALRLYLWNAQLGEAFHLPMQAAEVGLRNRVNNGLTSRFGSEWWNTQEFNVIIDADRRRDLEIVYGRIRNRRLPLVTGQIVAGLSFGFWVGLLDGRYNPPLWGKHLRTAFPNLPTTRSRKSLQKAASRVAWVRNRISHHEPIIGLDLLKEYATISDLLAWICPIKARWLKPHCRVPELVRAKP
jgi:hypothetical protein